jgi:hypothetical protein
MTLVSAGPTQLEGALMYRVARDSRRVALAAAIDGPARVTALREFVAPLSHNPREEHPGHLIRRLLTEYEDHLGQAVGYPGWLLRADDALLQAEHHAGLISLPDWVARRSHNPPAPTGRTRQRALGFLTRRDHAFLADIAARNSAVVRHPDGRCLWQGRDADDRMTSLYWLDLADAGPGTPPGEYQLTAGGQNLLAGLTDTTAPLAPGTVSTVTPGTGQDCRARGGHHSWQASRLVFTAKVDWQEYVCRRCPKTRRRKFADAW